MGKYKAPDKGVLPDVGAVSSASRSLKIAFVYSRRPYPMTRGDQLTVAHLIEYLFKRGHVVDFIFVDSGQPVQWHDDWLKSRCRTVVRHRSSPFRIFCGMLLALLRGQPLQIGYFNDSRQAHALSAALDADHYDVVYTYYIRSAEISLRAKNIAHSSEDKPRPLYVLALQLSQTLNLKRLRDQLAGTLKGLLYKLEHALMARYEARICDRFDRIVLIGDKDRQEIDINRTAFGLQPLKNHMFCAHGTDIAKFSPEGPIEPVDCGPMLLFSGNMGYEPNVDAICWFMHNVWPLLEAKNLGVTLYIVGKDPAAEVRALATTPRVFVTGTVNDVATWIRRADVCINPMQAAGGMQNKLLEYLACGKAVIATTVANEGIRATPGTDLVIADSPVDSANAIAALLREPSARHELGKAARGFVEKHWTWAGPFYSLEEDWLKSLRTYN